MKTIVFIVQQLSQPRCIKRISTIQDAGIPIKVYGFDTGLYSNNLQDLPFKIHESIKRDKTASRINKISFFHATIKRILKENKHNSIFYLFGFEIASIAFLLKCKNFIYEEADITASRFKNPLIRTTLTALDKQIIQKSLFTVLTSKGFIDYLYGHQFPHNIILQPNKLSTYFDERQKKLVKAKEFNTNHIKFGFIGAIRYPNTIIRFAQIIGSKFPQHEFHFYGAPEKQSYLATITNYKNIFFHGAFKNPTDLLRIYTNIDINVVCYDTTSGNVKIAEPNKLYESIFFETPLVVSSNTFLAKQVKKYNIGFNINASCNDDIIAFVNQLQSEQLQLISSNMHKINYTQLIDNSDTLLKNILTYVNS